jgi:sterol desaturase/sphingolipid hydroxylase (fatty acid hydroxylase superfamily)
LLFEDAGMVDALPSPAEPTVLRRWRHRTGLMLVGVLIAAAVLLRPQVLVGLVVLAAVFVPLERRWPLRRRSRRRPGVGTDVVHFLVNNLFILAGTVVVAVPFVVLSLALLPLPVRAFATTLPGPVELMAAVLIIAFTRYGSHRLSHTQPWLWRFHSVHHSSADLDWLASARLHPVDAVWANACTLVPLGLLGFSRASLGAYALVLAFSAIFDHANLRVRLPVVRWLMPNPEWHHWHHAGDPEAIDRNFSPYPWVDVLFGTAHLPTDRRPTSYGVPDPVPPTGYLAQLAYPFRRRPERESRSPGGRDASRPCLAANA